MPQGGYYEAGKEIKEGNHNDQRTRRSSLQGKATTFQILKLEWGRAVTTETYNHA